MIKKIFIYWAQGFCNAPIVVKRCLLSWKFKNPDWDIIELDDSNLHEYIDIKKEIPDIDEINITKTSYSDIVRIFLLEKFGGCWCDATTFCFMPLDKWLHKFIINDFFCFKKSKQNKKRVGNEFVSYFIYSNQNNYITQKLKKKIVEYCKNNKNIGGLLPIGLGRKATSNEINTYFWLHVLCQDLINNDKKIYNIFCKYPVRGTIIKPFFKCSYKKNKSYNEKFHSNINRIIFNNLNLKFIHIGKTGGSFIRETFHLPKYHLSRNYKSNEKYIIWIRNPLKRFVSAFNYVYDIITYDTINVNIKSLNLNNCLAPWWIKNKIKNNNDYIYTKRYDYLVNYFKNPNYLAESITSENEEEKKLALELMNNKIEHIFKGIGWYLYNGKFVEKNYKNILFVGSQENMINDVQKLDNIIGQKNKTPKLRENKNKHDKHLSKKAIQNLLEFYKNTDYKALETLMKYEFISKKLLDEYRTYNI